MHCIDLDNDDTIVDEDKMNEKIQRELDLDEKREADEKEAYQKKKEDILNEASERDKAIFSNALSKMHQDVNDFNKEMNAEAGEVDPDGEVEN
jgi:hypothetical protein